MALKKKFSRINPSKPPDTYESVDLNKVRGKINHFKPEEILEAVREQKRQLGRDIEKDATRLYLSETEFETQSLRVIRKFGSIKALSEALADIGSPRKPSTIYRWLYSKENGGTGGLIPTGSLPDLLKAAHFAGIFLTAEDLDSRATAKKHMKRVGTRTPEGAVVPHLTSIEKSRLKGHNILKERKRQRLKERARRRRNRLKTNVTREVAKRTKKLREQLSKVIHKNQILENRERKRQDYLKSKAKKEQK